MNDPDPRSNAPVPVAIQNWPTESAKKSTVKSTTFKTYIVDPANVNAKYFQVCDYEPTRMRMFVIVVDAAIALTDSQPTPSPDASTSAIAPNGAYLPPNTTNMPPYEFFGPDAMWINSLGTITRVTVVKEYGW